MPWIIDIDHIADTNCREGSNSNAKGLMGPGSYKGNGTELTHKFRIKDDDGNLYYTGRSGDSSDFGPLDDFGQPNAGATSIEYRVNGKWEIL